MSELLPEPGPLASRIDRYMSRKERLGELSAALSTLGLETRDLAVAIQTEVGDDVVILHRGMAFVPFVERDGLRVGYDRLPCLDLDQLRKPVVTPMPAEMADPGHVVDPGA